MLNDSRPLETYWLNTFVVLAESDSLRDAALKLNVTQPAISQHLKQLESRFQAQLIIRRTRPLRLTAPGKVLYQHAVSLLAELRRIDDLVRDAEDQGLIQCRLGLITSISEVAGSQIIANLKDKSERITIRSGLTNELKDAFLQRDIDILISNDSMPEISDIERVKIFRDPMLVAYPKVWENTFDGSLQNLAATMPLIRYGRNTSVGVFSDVTLRRINLSVKFKYETDDTHSLLIFVEAGHGWGLLSFLCVAQCMHRMHNIKLMSLDSERHARNIYLIYRKNEMRTIPLRIADILKQHFFDNVFPQLKQHAPWIDQSAFIVDTA
ncbi:LysR family transcriptional regulator [Salinicola corii]|uniref:LysR family transcriptional regulator n=1 Tax=Salinicola corii TaxID=2606937 RepID=UPI001659C09C|nr:LysR family transcriptional regulator [Salinicola corii]